MISRTCFIGIFTILASTTCLQGQSNANLQAKSGALAKAVPVASEGPEQGWRTITGRILDFNKEALFGGEVYGRLGGSIPFSAISNLKGEYQIKIPKTQSRLEYSYEGFDYGEIALGDEDTLNVILLYYGAYGISPELEAIQYTQPSKRPFSIKVRGKIQSGGPQEAIGPYVRIEGTKDKIFPDAEGNFEFMAPPGRDILSFESENFPARKVLLPDLRSVYIPVKLWPGKPEQSKKRRKNYKPS
ncbi:MAG: hypothetical protein SFV55_25495 [Haliscomenobacter sp.]|uniref:hypothetical protein n=1 Tax=Haliscomenobacter sp. TaxID=2717303 RepID=UPI0029A511B5|nr:hypothetical protein [Haliscomenobacter sp.]MDX2071813.1 hypothetical protein [Haliscomenobacter sp.]